MLRDWDLCVEGPLSGIVLRNFEQQQKSYCGRRRRIKEMFGEIASNEGPLQRREALEHSVTWRWWMTAASDKRWMEQLAWSLSRWGRWVGSGHKPSGHLFEVWSWKGMRSAPFTFLYVDLSMLILEGNPGMGTWNHRHILEVRILLCVLNSPTYPTLPYDLLHCSCYFLVPEAVDDRIQHGCEDCIEDGYYVILARRVVGCR